MSGVVMCAMLFVLSGPWKKQGRRQERGPAAQRRYSISVCLDSGGKIPQVPCKTGKNRPISSL